MSSRGGMSKMSSRGAISHLKKDVSASGISLGSITFGGVNNNFDDAL